MRDATGERYRFSLAAIAGAGRNRAGEQPLLTQLDNGS